MLILIVLLILFRARGDIFRNAASDLWISILFLAFIPVAAYPLQPVLPKYKDKGREGQRNLALLFSLLGYVCALLFGLFFHVTSELFLIYCSYILSILALLFFNKIIKFRSSGHMCAVTGPLILLVYFVGWAALIPCLLLFVLVWWASLSTKRHTFPELLGGFLSCVVAYLASLAVVSLMRIQ